MTKEDDAPIARDGTIGAPWPPQDHDARSGSTRIWFVMSFTPRTESATRSASYFISRVGTVPFSVTSQSATRTSTSLQSWPCAERRSQISSCMLASERT